MKILVTMRRIAEKTYSKINPQYKHVIRTRNAVFDMQNRIYELERKLSAIEASVNSNASERQFVTDEVTTYRFLYLRRYICGGEKVLDLEGGFGAGIRLLAQYTTIDCGVCYNSIGYYSRMADMLYGDDNDSVHYCHGTIHDVKDKYDIITCFNEKKNDFLGDDDLNWIYECLESNGIIGMALNPVNADCVIDSLRAKGFSLEKLLYQNNAWPELIEEKGINPVTIVYLRKKS